MARLVADGMKAGGLGLSTGLYYAPGSYARTDEIVALAKVAGEFGGVYASHIRDEADYSIGVVAAVDEVIRISEQAHIRAVVSHMKALGPANWGKSVPLVDAIERARARGLEVFADQYAYEASGTSLVAALIPRWAEAGGRSAMLGRLDGGEAGPDPRRPSPTTSSGAAAQARWSSRTTRPTTPSRGGRWRRLPARRLVSPADLVVTLLRQGDAALVSFNMSDDDIVRIMRQPWTMTCSDGDLTAPGQGKPHPRGYGAFARKVAVYVRDRHVIDLPQAIRSMTSLPAAVFGLRDRGVLRARRDRRHCRLRSRPASGSRDVSGAAAARRRRPRGARERHRGVGRRRRRRARRTGRFVRPER